MPVNQTSCLAFSNPFGEFPMNCLMIAKRTTAKLLFGSGLPSLLLLSLCEGRCTAQAIDPTGSSKTITSFAHSTEDPALTVSVLVSPPVHGERADEGQPTTSESKTADRKREKNVTQKEVGGRKMKRRRGKRKKLRHQRIRRQRMRRKACRKPMRRVKNRRRTAPQPPQPSDTKILIFLPRTTG